VLSRFEGPITVRVTGPAPQNLYSDLNRLLARLRREAGIGISPAPEGGPASITIEVVPRAELRRYVPQAACFVVPRVTSWDEFRRHRRGATVDWTTLQTRERMAIFLPGDVAPQEVRDCLHEELAQALGPLNDLYRLPDSVFNDDNFHTVLTGFDMLILRAYYAPELRSGMTRGPQVAARLPGILARLNPAASGRSRCPRRHPARLDRRDRGGAWPAHLADSPPPGRARRAVEIARRTAGPTTAWPSACSRWAACRCGRERHRAGLVPAGRQIYAARPETGCRAHVAMQLAAFALSARASPRPRSSWSTTTWPSVAEAENAALLATLLMIMFLPFFDVPALRAARTGVPVSLREYLAFLEGHAPGS
jgi:hypothetical protein